MVSNKNIYHYSFHLQKIIVEEKTCGSVICVRSRPVEWGNVIRHIREVHKIDDPNAQNATKNSNTGVKSNGKDKTTKVSNGQQRTIMDAGIPLSEHITDLQNGGHFPRHDLRMDEEDDESRTNPVDGLYASEQIEKFEDMTRKKCHILDCVLDTFPDHLKTKAKHMCDTLKCKDRLFILSSHEIVIDGKVDRGSNIRDYIMDSLIEPPKPRTTKFTMLEKENERLKQNLAYYEKALARARGLWRYRKFESIIDGTVDRCDFSDDTNSDESDGEDDPDETEEDADEDNDEDEYDDDEDEEDDMDDTEEEDDEPSRKRKKKN